MFSIFNEENMEIHKIILSTEIEYVGRTKRRKKSLKIKTLKIFDFLLLMAAQWRRVTFSTSLALTLYPPSMISYSRRRENFSIRIELGQSQKYFNTIRDVLNMTPKDNFCFQFAEV